MQCHCLQLVSSSCAISSCCPPFSTTSPLPSSITSSCFSPSSFPPPSSSSSFWLSCCGSSAAAAGCFLYTRMHKLTWAGTHNFHVAPYEQKRYLSKQVCPKRPHFQLAIKQEVEVWVVVSTATDTSSPVIRGLLHPPPSTLHPSPLCCTSVPIGGQDTGLPLDVINTNLVSSAANLSNMLANRFFSLSLWLFSLFREAMIWAFAALFVGSIFCTSWKSTIASS